MMCRLLFLFLWAMAWAVPVCAQNNIPLGTWRTHLSYNRTTGLAIAGDQVFCASENGYFTFDSRDNSLERFGPTEGLSDNGLSTIGYHAPTQQLVIGYQNGNIDIISESTIFNISNIKDAEIENNKSINSILFIGNTAYLATGFGVVIIDMERPQIREVVRNLGGLDNGINVHDITLYQDSLFAATALGVMAAPASGAINLLDFNNWRVYGAADNAPDTATQTLAVFNNQLYVGVSEKSLFQYDGTTWANTGLFDGATFNNLSSNEDVLLASLGEQLVSLDQALTPSIIAYTESPMPVKALVGENQTLWVADGINGLIGNASGSFESFFPSGPFTDGTRRLQWLNNQLYALPGSFNTTNGLGTGDRNGFSVLDNGAWDNFTPLSAGRTTRLPEVTDLMDAAFDGASGNLYLASFGFGILVVSPDGNFTIIDENTPGSPLENISTVGNRRVHISALHANNAGLWVGNYGARNSIHLLRNDGSWESFSFFQAEFPLQINSSVNNHLWIHFDPSQDGSVFVFDPESGLNRRLSSEAGNLPSNDVNDVAFGQNNEAWVATDEGIAFFPSASEALREGAFEFIEPRFDGLPLFSDENVSSVEVDAGNRVWMATNDGAWLFSDGLERLVYNFNEDNSPLLSNNILDIKIDPNSGEVFFATDRGLVSFRAAATTPLGPAKIFPNPVTNTFNGLVGISGLPANAVVKITDIAGKLIFETRAAGGTATWDVRGVDGKRAQTGMYIVLTASDDGEETSVGKIAVVN